MATRATVSILLAVLCGTAAASGYAATDSGAPRFRGISADVDLFHVGPWFYDDPMDVYGGSGAGGRSGLGLRLSYAPSGNLAPYVAMHLITHDWGQQNGTYTSVGMQLRQPWKRRIMPFANAGVGHLSDRGIRVSYNFAEFGGGIQLFVSGRLAFHPALEFIRTLGDGKRELDGGRTRDVPLDVNPWRASFGLTWYMGKRAT